MVFQTMGGDGYLEKYVIVGGNKLTGSVTISGGKFGIDHLACLFIV